MYGGEAGEPHDLMHPVWTKAKDRLEEAKEKQKFYYDRNTKRIDYKIGDKFILKTLAGIPGKFNMRLEGPFQ